MSPISLFPFDLATIHIYIYMYINTDVYTFLDAQDPAFKNIQRYPNRKSP